MSLTDSITNYFYSDEKFN